MKIKIIILCLITSLVIISCTSNLDSIPADNETPSPEVSLDVSVSITPTTIDLESTKATSIEVETSTVIEESQCELPCWQGVLPGVTTWTDLGLPTIDDQIFGDFAFSPQEKLYNTFVGFRNGKIEYFYDLPPDYDFMETRLYISATDLDTIHRVDIGIYNSENPYTISSLFQLYGEPLDLRMWRYFKGSGVGYIHVGFYFPEHGIVARSVTRYDAPDTGVREICLERKVSLQLWNPEELKLFDDFSAYFDSITNMRFSSHPPLPSKESIETYTNLSSYEELLQQLESGQYCFEFNLDGDW